MFNNRARSKGKARNFQRHTACLTVKQEKFFITVPNGEKTKTEGFALINQAIHTLEPVRFFTDMREKFLAVRVLVDLWYI